MVIETTKTCVGPYINENFTNLNIYHILLKTKMLKKKLLQRRTFRLIKNLFFPKMYSKIYISIPYNLNVWNILLWMIAPSFPRPKCPFLHRRCQCAQNISCWWRTNLQPLSATCRIQTFTLNTSIEITSYHELIIITLPLNLKLGCQDNKLLFRSF